MDIKLLLYKILQKRTRTFIQTILDEARSKIDSLKRAQVGRRYQNFFLYKTILLLNLFYASVLTYFESSKMSFMNLISNDPAIDDSLELKTEILNGPIVYLQYLNK